MSFLKYIFINITATLLRLFPFSTKTGLIRIGNPDETSPVLLTCNYYLTVERVKRALRETNVYLLVANSRGTNVWCAAAGGYFTIHDVISIIKTSGIEGLVTHRNIILPQLAAPRIEAKSVLQKTGWRVIWGPVYARDIPEFIKNNFKKTPEMQRVEFPWIQRLEMAVAWAFPISVISTIIMFILWRDAIPVLIGLISALSLLLFITFPLYSRWLATKTKKTGFITFDIARATLQIILWGIGSAGIIFYSYMSGDLTFKHILLLELLSLIIVLLLTIDLLGSTPVYKGGEDENKLSIIIDESKCKGTGICEQVCPKGCYTVVKKHSVAMIEKDRCVKCGACIVQCPFDALYFKEVSGKILSPETIRKFKLNLKGKRAVRVEE
jgi:NAD-dependent dihydropyrimidine dehydrogenase PreA subunit